MEIGADQVKELREKSGAGLMDCKRALQETKGDLDKALEHLRKSGVVKAAKKVGRVTLEGLIGEAHSEDLSAAALIEVNCETDFVARTDQFQGWMKEVVSLALRRQPQNLEGLLDQKLGAGTVASSLTDLIAKLGENMGVRRVAVFQAGSGEKVGSYLHMGAKIGTLIKIRGNVEASVLRDIAMHVAALHPRYLDRASVPGDVVIKEKEILMAQPDMTGKPAHLLDKIAEGKLSRFYSEACLTEQPFIKDPTGKKSVAAFLKEKDPQAKLLEMARFQVGGDTHA